MSKGSVQPSCAQPARVTAVLKFLQLTLLRVALVVESSELCKRCAEVHVLRVSALCSSAQPAQTTNSKRRAAVRWVTHTESDACLAAPLLLIALSLFDLTGAAARQTQVPFRSTHLSMMPSGDFERDGTNSNAKRSGCAELRAESGYSGIVQARGVTLSPRKSAKLAFASTPVLCPAAFEKANFLPKVGRELEDMERG